MMEGVDFLTILGYILHGGGESVITLLLAIVALLLYDRKSMVVSVTESNKLTLEAKEAEKKVILEILDKYHQGHLTIAQALSDIKVVLATLQGRG